MTIRNLMMAAVQSPQGPELNLDMTAASLDARVTITRALNTGTRVNSSGYVEVVNADLPRFDYAPDSVGTCNGLLVEETRTNEVIRSGDLGHAAWGGANVTVTSASGASPDNTNTATLVTEDGTSAIHYFGVQTATFTANQQATFSCWLKNGSRRYVIVNLGDNIATDKWVAAVVDLQTGTITQSSAGASATLLSTSIKAYPNGWYRVTVSGYYNATAYQTRLCLSNSGTPTLSFYGLLSYAGDGVSTIYAWGGQLEQGGFASSYIPTVAAAALRNADVATLTAANFSDWYSATNGTFRADFSTLSSGNRTVFQVDDGSNDNRIVLFVNSSTNNLAITTATVSQCAVSAGTVSSQVATYAYVSYHALRMGVASGASQSVDTGGTLPTVDRLRLGVDAASNYLNGHIKKLAYWP